MGKHVASVFRSWDVRRRLLLRYEAIVGGDDPSALPQMLHRIHEFLGVDGASHIKAFVAQERIHRFRAHALYTALLGQPSISFETARPLSADLSRRSLAFVRRR